MRHRQRTASRWSFVCGTLRLVESLVRLGAEDAGEVLTLQRAAYVTEAQAHADLNLPPLRQSFAEVAAELADPEVLALAWRDPSGRLVAAVRARVTKDNSRVAEIGRLTVVPDYQGQRLGTRLLAAVEEQLPATVVALRLFTGEHSAGNLRLYARLGYRESCRQLTPAGYRLVHLHQGPPLVRLTTDSRHGRPRLQPLGDEVAWTI